MKMIILSIVSFAFALAPVLAFSGEAEYGVNTGAPSPVSSLKSIDGKEINLKDSSPKVLVFYRGSWCPYCMNQLRAINKKLLPKLEGKASLIAISTDPNKKAVKMRRKYGFNFDIVSDPKAETIKAFRIVNQRFLSGDIIAHPSVFIIQDGRIVFADVHTDYKKRTAHQKILNALN